ncbi:chromatin associated protein KTI12 [Fomitiporia mediterranea MF3/22]|uniref:chromatin associated protein KTI12 n=1 Tax=Fomitiporia mediterranea (strain MF3/22) TaxID=694068 RepID=UPI000440758E|nr:chromatin associated protein KTI12 [Fomitiporia mediterranea MF3/22]EJD02833.1 chromatin associated protein KTI12 [Fomitiporia mediterranea MF3/22]
MALVTISGYPASGKSCRAQQLKTFLEDRIQNPSYDGPKLKVTVISDDNLNIKRHVYDDGRQEKPARASLFTAMQRAIGKDTIVIVDGMNYIKGYRYQMYCAAREHRIRVCTVFVVAKPEQCREWNAAREEESDSYSTATYVLQIAAVYRLFHQSLRLDNLIMRYEEPSSMVRWDSPLFTVPWTDENLPEEDIWKAIMEGVVKPPNAGTSAVAVAPTDALHTLEATVAAMVSAITSEQAASQGLGIGGEIILPLSATVKPRLRLPARNITLSELQRLKRQFVTIHKKAITLGTTEKGAVDWSEDKVAEKFVTYLEENLKP